MKHTYLIYDLLSSLPLALIVTEKTEDLDVIKKLYLDLIDTEEHVLELRCTKVDRVTFIDLLIKKTPLIHI